MTNGEQLSKDLMLKRIADLKGMVQNAIVPDTCEYGKVAKECQILDLDVMEFKINQPPSVPIVKDAFIQWKGLKVSGEVAVIGFLMLVFVLVAGYGAWAITDNQSTMSQKIAKVETVIEAISK